MSEKRWPLLFRDPNRQGHVEIFSGEYILHVNGGRGVIYCDLAMSREEAVSVASQLLAACDVTSASELIEIANRQPTPV